VRDVFDAGSYIMWASGRGWALEIESFLGPVKWHRVDRRVPFWALETNAVWSVSKAVSWEGSLNLQRTFRLSSSVSIAYRSVRVQRS
jgi:hypothetical protein